jgi:hypothetical protein
MYGNRRRKLLVRGIAAATSIVVGALCVGTLRAEDDHFVQTNLVSDLSGLAAVTDTALKNPWGLSHFGEPSIGAALSMCSAVVRRIWKTRTGRAMFLRFWSPRSSKSNSSLSPMWSRTVPDMQMPPGSARASNQAATFTPSPWMSSPSTMMSPRLTR